MRKILLVLFFCLVVVLSCVKGDKWETMTRQDCKYGCLKTCNTHRYHNSECIDQGGIFPKYADCHCWGETGFNDYD